MGAVFRVVLQILLMFSVPPHVNCKEDGRGSGYIPENTTYPKQPEKLAEIKGVAAHTIADKRAYPLADVCMALGYQINHCEDAIIVTGGDQRFRISTIDNPELQMLNGVAYCTISIFNTLFGIAFRYQECGGLLSVFK